MPMNDPAVGQLFLLAFDGPTPDPVLPLLRDYRIGGLYLSNDNLREPRQSARLLNVLQDASMREPHGAPLITAADQEGAWAVVTPYSSAGPGNLALGHADAALTEQMYGVFGAELEAIGVFCDLAPVSDVTSDPRSPIIGQRAFGETPDVVSERVALAVKGLHRHGIMAAAKHFPGHGNTAQDTHRELAHVRRDADAIRKVDFAPFASAIRAGVDMVMTAHIVYEAFDAEHPATLSSRLLKDVLRGDLGFEGVVVSDSFSMDAIRKSYAPADAAVAAINAGVDMIMLAEERYGDDVGDYVATQRAILERVSAAVRTGEIARSRFDEAVARIAALRETYDLASRALVDEGRAASVLGKPEHRSVELISARAAVRIVFDHSGVLPFDSATRVGVVSLVPEGARAVVHDTRGIGPNYSEGFDVLVRALEAHCDAVVLEPEQTPPPDVQVVVAVTENYPLPGKSFEVDSQTRRLEKLRGRFGGKVVVAGLRDAYDADAVVADAYVAAFGFRASNARALAESLFQRDVGHLTAGNLPTP